MKKGKVYLVGTGPAGKDLITLKGYKILRQADVVIYDYLVDKELLEDVKPGVELICCDKLGKKRHLDGFSNAQDKINSLLVKKAKEGKCVLRLKNGDPALFSRLSQELEVLTSRGIEFEIVPGVTAASAASCLSGVPLTDRRLASSVVFVTGHEHLGKKEKGVNWDDIAGCGTVVLYMAVENISGIVKRLIAAGKSPATPALVVSGAYKLSQRILRNRLDGIPLAVKKERIKPPAIFIIGEVANFEKRFNWIRKNKRILFTGLSNQRFYLKGTHYHLPLVKISALGDYRQMDRHLNDISGYDWIVFGSRYGVEYFFKRLEKKGFDSRKLKGIKIAAIGNSTRDRLKAFGITADLVPRKESSQGLVEEFRRIGINGKRIFLPRSDISDKGLEKSLTGIGASVTRCVAYRNLRRTDLPDLNLEAFDEIIFCSPSGVRSFVKRYGLPAKKISIKCIGKVTRAEAEKLHLL